MALLAVRAPVAACGAVHDLTAARIWGIVRELAAAGLIIPTDKGYHGAGQHVLTPYPWDGTSPPP